MHGLTQDSPPHSGIRNRCGGKYFARPKLRTCIPCFSDHFLYLSSFSDLFLYRLCFVPHRDADSGYTLSVGRGQPGVAAAAAAASDGLALPTVFEQAAAGVGVGGMGTDVAQVCIVRDGDTARMGGCEEQTRLTLQVRSKAKHAQRSIIDKYVKRQHRADFVPKIER